MKLTQNAETLEAMCAENNVKILNRVGRQIQAQRPDGLIVFFDRFSKNSPDAGLLEALNSIRLFGKKEDVILAVGMARGLQVARGYAGRYSPESTKKVMQAIKAFIGGSGYRSKSKKLEKLIG